MTTTTVMGAIIFSLFILFIIYIFSVRRDKRIKKKLLENYDESEDLGKQAEQNRQELLKGGSESSSSREPSFADIDGLGKQQGVSLPPSSPVGQDSDSVGGDGILKHKTGRRPRGIFKRLRTNRTKQ